MFLYNKLLKVEYNANAFLIDEFRRIVFLVSTLLELIVCVNNSWWPRVLLYLAARLTTMSLDNIPEGSVSHINGQQIATTLITRMVQNKKMKATCE